MLQSLFVCTVVHLIPYLHYFAHVRYITQKNRHVLRYYIYIILQYVVEPKVHSVQSDFSTYVNPHSPKKLPIVKKLYLRTVPNYTNVHHVSHSKSEKHRPDLPTIQNFWITNIQQNTPTSIHKLRTTHRICRRS